MAQTVLPSAIGSIKDKSKIRVVIYANGKLVHVSLAELLAAANPPTEG
ncbi:hypothetical protein HBA94_08060 [Ochrobactrum sp. GRS2]|nr:hypothetical protein [Ochrobactrum sp. GRS2]